MLVFASAIVTLLAAQLAVVGGRLEAAHECVHDEVTSRHEVLHAPQAYSASRRALATSEHPGLRVTFNTELLGAADERTCTRAGQTVTIGSPVGGARCAADSRGDCVYTCTAADVLSAAHAQTLASVLLPPAARWFESALHIRKPVVGRLNVRASTRAGGDVCDFDVPRQLVRRGPEA